MVNIKSTKVGKNGKAFAIGEHKCKCKNMQPYNSYVKVKGAADNKYYGIACLRCMNCLGVVYAPAERCYIQY